MPIVRYTTLIHAPVEQVFAFHESADALARLTPPWERTVIEEPPASLEVGTKVVLRVKVGPIWQRWVAEHVAYEPDHFFADRQLSGPFAAWLHRHLFEAVDEGGERCTMMTDELTYELPLGPLGTLFGGRFVRTKLDRLFEYRHRVTREVCESAPP